MDTKKKKNAMHVNPKHKLYKKKKSVKNLKTENFQFRSVKHRSNTNRARQIQTKIFIAILIDRKSGKIKFLKSRAV